MKECYTKDTAPYILQAGQWKVWGESKVGDDRLTGSYRGSQK